MASTEDWRSLRATGLAHHPNVSVATYQAPYSESRLRETINGYRGSPLHAVLETFFNIRDYSDAMLTDRRLFCQVQVSYCQSSCLPQHCSSGLHALLIVLQHSMQDIDMHRNGAHKHMLTDFLPFLTPCIMIMLHIRPPSLCVVQLRA